MPFPASVVCKPDDFAAAYLGKLAGDGVKEMEGTVFNRGVRGRAGNTMRNHQPAGERPWPLAVQRYWTGWK
jgi:hypothetical protein